MNSKKELTLYEIQKCELGILKYIHNICEKNNIYYCLEAGSLLGAVRHRGFIPWDDDIDIIVPRKDYRKLLDAIINDSTQNDYKVLSMYNCDDYIYPYAKIVDTRTELIEKCYKTVKDMGIFVDVFPVDNLPNGKTNRFFHQKCFVLFSTILNYLRQTKKDRENHNAVRKFNYLISRIFFGKPAIALRVIDKITSLYNSRKCRYSSNIVGATNPYIIVPENIFKERMLSKFEDGEFYIPKKYDEYLTILYGDYMKLPPKEKQVHTHSFKAYLND